VLSLTTSPGWVGREVYLTIEATRSAGYCRVASSETVHCEGSSGSHPPARYRKFSPLTWTLSRYNTNFAPSNVRPYIHIYIFLSLFLYQYTSPPPPCACTSSDYVCLHVCAHACKCLRHQVVQSASDRKCWKVIIR